MEYCISKPGVILSKFVKNYWAVENCIPQNHEHIQRIVPNGLFEVIFYFSDKPVLKDTNRSMNGNSLMTGQLREFYDIGVSGKISLFSIQFRPQGIAMFLDIPLNEIYNQNVPLKFIFGNDADVLEEKLFEAGSFTERTSIVERFLLKLLRKNRNTYNLDRIESCVTLINRSKGVVDVDFLASEACYSRKQFERIFSQYIGTSPKQFLKIIRFQNAIDEKSKNRNLNLTGLTFKCGYYDQSHMINDFQKLSGMPPKKYFNECVPYSDYFQ